MNNDYYNLASSKVRIELSMPLTASARAWLVSKLKDEPGIKNIEFSDEDSRNMYVTYSPSSLSVYLLLDVIRSYYACANLSSKLYFNDNTYLKHAS